MLLRQRSQTIAVFPRPVIVGLIPNKEQSRRNSVTRLLQTRPLYYLYEIVTSPISFPTTSSKAWLYTLGHFQRSQCNQTGIGLHARRGFDRNSPRQRNYIRLVRVLVRVPNSSTGQLSLILRQQPVILDDLRTSNLLGNRNVIDSKQIFKSSLKVGIFLESRIDSQINIDILKIGIFLKYEILDIDSQILVPKNRNFRIAVSIRDGWN